MKSNIINLIFVLLIIIIFGETFVLAKVVINDGYFQSNLSGRLLRKVGINASEREDLSLVSWGTFLEYLEYEADVTFIGDLITRCHNCQKDYPIRK